MSPYPFDQQTASYSAPHNWLMGLILDLDAPSHLVGVLVVLAMPVKKLSKMVGNSASYPLIVGEWIDYK